MCISWIFDDICPPRCERCRGPLATDDECESGVCLDCVQDEARQAFDDECDRLAAESGRLDDAEPVAALTDDDLPF